MVVENQDGSVGNEQRSCGILDAAEVDGIKNLEEALKEDTFMDADKGAYVKASRELYSAPTRHTSSEASTIVQSTTGLEGVESLHNSRRITIEEFW